MASVGSLTHLCNHLYMFNNLICCSGADVLLILVICAN